MITFAVKLIQKKIKFCYTAESVTFAAPTRPCLYDVREGEIFKLSTQVFSPMKSSKISPQRDSCTVYNQHGVNEDNASKVCLQQL